MNWKAFHNRGEILRAVIATADQRRDGELPMDVPGVAETFRDDLDLLGALQLKWHARLSGRIERQLAEQPLDLDHAACLAWSEAAAELAGVRLILDNYRVHPTDYAMAGAMLKATAKEHQLLAATAGFTSIGTPAANEAATRLGAEIEERARRLHRGVVAMSEQPSQARPSFLERLRASWVA